MNSRTLKKFNLKDGTYIRYEKKGIGPTLILLHTFRNRLEYSDLLIPQLEKSFTVFTIDLPGFGDSPINNKTEYDQSFFTNTIVEFIHELDLDEVTIAGESIGGVLPLTVAYQLPKKIKKIYCFNPYDYDGKFAEGIRRGNFFANFILFNVGIPILGRLFASLENRFILKNVLKGGFVDYSKLSTDYLNLLISSTKKKEYVYHFRNVLANFKTWNDCKEIYESLNQPISLIYGESDWSSKKEREDSQKRLKLDSYITLKNCGHFSFLEKPLEVSKIILENR